jgi:pilus assembly protein CpaB
MTTDKKTIIFALALALLAGISTFLYIHQREREILRHAKETPVVIATKDILENSMIDESMVSQGKIPRLFLQPGSVADANTIIGQISTGPIKKGEQILWTKLTRPGFESGLALKIPVGRRAVSILVDEISGVAGLIKPNDYVDVLATFDYGDDSRSKQYTFTILEGIYVLAVDQDLGNYNLYHHLDNKYDKKQDLMSKLELDEPKKTAKTLTLSLTPDETQKIIFAQENATLNVSLRPRFESDTKLELEPATAETATGRDGLLKGQRRPVYREYKGR